MAIHLYQSSRRRRLLTLPIVLGSTWTLTAGCAAPHVATPNNKPLPPPRIRAGDMWIYSEINRYNGSEVSRVEENVSAAGPVVTVDTRMRPAEFSAGRVLRSERDEAVFGGRWQVRRELFYDDPLEFAVPMPLLPSQLLAGQSHEDRTFFIAQGSSRRYTWYQRLSSAGMTSIVVPAGRFETLEVRRDIYCITRHISPNRLHAPLSPSLRPALSPQRYPAGYATRPPRSRHGTQSSQDTVHLKLASSQITAPFTQIN